MKARTTILIRYCLTLLVLIVCYMMFAVVSCFMPDDRVRQHVHYSIEKGDLHSDYPRAVIPEKSAQMDNFTDALIINQACHLRRNAIIQNIMLLPRADFGVVDQSSTLQLYMQGQDENIITYPRYWHGSTFLMRYLLIFFDYPSIRLLLYLISSLLLGWLLIRLWQIKGWIPVAAIGIAFVLVYGYVMQFSMQCCPVLALALIGSLLVCKDFSTPRRIFLYFFIIGSLTAYFDLLTAPLLSLGLPLVLFCYLYEDKRPTAKPALLAPLSQIVGAGLLWSVGFITTWAIKWLLASILTSKNVFKDAFGQVSFRMGSAENIWELADFSRWTAITSNIDLIPSKLFCIVIAVMIVLSVLHFNRNGWQRALLLLMVALLPYLWYFMLANHSYQHWWFTYRAQMVSIVAMILSIASIIDWSGIKSKYKLFNFKK